MNEPKTIPLTKGMVTLVSPEDYEALSQYNWHVTSGGYAARNRADGQYIYMHREINRTPDGFETDHRDGDRLRNTRENLRTATHLQNGRNQLKQSVPRSSTFKGVSFRPSRSQKDGRAGCWQAYLKVVGKKKTLGNFKTELDGAFAYNIAAKEHYGEFAALNQLPLDYLASHDKPEIFCGRNHSRFRGVTFHKAMNKWAAYGGTGSARVMSFHATEQEAGHAYNNLAKSLYGDKARLNVIT